jgi:peptidoglycan/xylan/chitin deacetylase (PgdA/CDA1 family)
MYHQVGPHRSGSGLNKWRVPLPLFRRHVDLLSRRGYTGVPLRRLLDSDLDGVRRPVVLTFDDGFDGVRTGALPVLREAGFSATVFVVAGKLGGVNDWDGERPGERLLDAGGIRELAGAGFEIGSHGTTHRALPGLGDQELEDETAGGRRLLEQVTGTPVVSFCYPYGAFDDRSVLAVRSAGYRAATVIRSGLSPAGSDPYRLRRVPVRGTDPLLDLALSLTRGRSKF